jgi:hypothetical protein
MIKDCYSDVNFFILNSKFSILNSNDMVTLPI